MKVRLFVDSDTCFVFSSRAKAFKYVSTHNLSQFCILTEMKSYPDLKIDHTHSVYSSLSETVQWFESENEALKCIGSILN